MNLISKLQSKPEAVRRKIALFTTISLGLIVVIIWAVTFYFNMTGARKDTQHSPFESMKEMFSNISSKFGEQKASVKDSFKINE